MEILQIQKDETTEWLKNLHYAKRLPASISYAFGIYENKILKGIITYGSPSGRELAQMICGDDFMHEVLELNRLVLLDNKKNQASFLIANGMKLLPKPKIVVTYADTNMNHHGFVYQACNFIYTGLSKPRAKFFAPNGTEIAERTLSEWQGFNTRQETLKKYNIRVERQEGKHRYVYFVTTKTMKKERMKHFKLDNLPYPKGDNQVYDVDYKPNVQGLLF